MFRPAVGTLRAIKSPGELALIQKAIDPSIDAHLEAMKMMRPGLYEYQVAARMVEIHAYAGCETEAYAPIVGTGFNSTVLHYNKLDRRIEDGDIVLMDVGGQYSGYASDITRTVPANGKFTPRQREIYEIVLGAQNAAMEALKPGMTLGGTAADEPAENCHGLHRFARQGLKKAARSGGITFTASATTWGSMCTIRAGRRGRSSREWSSPSSRGFTFPRKISACASRTTCSSRRPATNSSPRACRARPTKLKRSWRKGKPSARSSALS